MIIVQPLSECQYALNKLKMTKVSNKPEQVYMIKRVLSHMPRSGYYHEIAVK